jgi:hypothetical protein
MSLSLPSTISVRGVTYGTPRVGTPEFATFFDSKVSNFQRINHDHDPIPTVPGRFLGFQHPSGEIHLSDDGPITTCLGEDDGTDAACSDDVVSNLLKSNILDHLGPYGSAGIHMGTIFCT